MSYTMYTPLNVWLDPASVTDVVAYIQTYLSENTIYSETEIETIIHDYLIAHPELIGGVQSVNGKTGTVVLSASDINTANNVTIESVLASLSSQISSIAASVATNTNNITSLTGRMTTAETDLTNLKSNINNSNQTLLELGITGSTVLSDPLFGTWGNGYVNGATGTVDKTLLRRICQYDIAKYGYDLKLTVNNNFWITVTYYNNGVFDTTDFNITGNYIVPNNREFRITIRRITEDMSETADITEFLNAVNVNTNFLTDIRTAISNNSDTIDKIVDFSNNANLIIWTNISIDTYLEANGTTISNVNNWTSDFIEVEPNTQYAYSLAATQQAAYLSAVFYDNNKIRISNVTNVASFTTPTNCKYIKVCRSYQNASGTGASAGINSDNYLTADYFINKTNLQIGSAGSVPENNYLKKDIRIETWFKGKKILTYGDSIVEQNKWQPYCKQYFGADTFWNGGGVGGTTVYNNGGTVTWPGTSTPVDSWMCSDARINRLQRIYGSLDCIIVLAGHNDWSESCPIGEIGTALVDSNFKSAYALMIKKLVDAFPGRPIFCCTPINGRVNTAGVNQDVQETNQLGLTMTDYAEAVIDVCRHYGIPCIDLNGESGISVLNAATYLADVIHPNDAGGKKIANAVINGMKRFEPIDL